MFESMETEFELTLRGTRAEPLYSGTLVCRERFNPFPLAGHLGRIQFLL